MRISMLSVTKLMMTVFLTASFIAGNLYAQTAMNNVGGRSNTTSLNGKWTVIIDPNDSGDYRRVWEERKPQKKTDFIEYSFDGGPTLEVPGDFNTQMCELTWYEGTVWYRKHFNYNLQTGNRLFLHFGAVNYLAVVYLNGQEIGRHEGGFTPFQYEVTDRVQEGSNTVIVKVTNNRLGNGLPGFGYDWFNYGGINRDVDLIETGPAFIEDYFIQLKKGSLETVQGWVKLNGAGSGQSIEVKIPELGILYRSVTDASGLARVEFTSKFQHWSPQNPKLYKVTIEAGTETVADEIGFRSIETRGSEVLLNGKPIFIKAVNIHEENPLKRARAHSIEDVRVLLNAAKELGCNMVRLVHYPHSENMVKEAEKMGLMVWNELPVYQHIQFSDSLMSAKLELMLNEMMRRDRNRAAVVVWCLSNETYPGTPNRDEALIALTGKTRAQDSSRLVVHVINTQGYNNNTFNVWDPLYEYSDMVALNEYIGWYIPWQGKPSETKWNLAFPDKPVFISEFGGEAKYGNNEGPTDEAAYWTEGYLEQIYINQVEMFGTVPNLVGVCPWLLFDYRSLVRMNQIYQNGFNRKGLLDEDGNKKKAWYIMNEYFKKH